MAAIRKPAGLAKSLPMRDPGATHPAIVFALLASAALNVLLAASLLRSTPGATTATAAANQTQTIATPLGSARSAPAPVVAGPIAAPTNAPPPFHWREIESDDYRQYIANLRAVGCPEQTIRDLIAADLAQLYAPRAAVIWQRKTPAYWQKYGRDEPAPGQLEALEALADKQGAVYKELLGASFSHQGWIDLLFLQDNGESTLLFLPDDKREAAQRVLDEAGLRDKEMELHSRQGGYSSEAQKRLFKEKLELLAQVLSPEEVEEFRLRYSPTADLLRSETKYFDCTPEEFRQLLDAREQSDKVVTGDFSNRTPATEQIRQLFGDDRAKEFERVSDMYYQNARDGLERTGQPAELADQAWEITREVRATAERVAQDSTLSVEERKRQIEALRAETDRRLNELLGERAARGVRQNLGVVLEVAGANVKP